MPPKVLSKPHHERNNGPAGVLPVPASARAPPQKQQNTARLKLEVRRLPPGLTLVEFEDALGSEWRLGGGKVDWREFRQGKVRKNNKLPEMGRCYVHVTNENLVKDFEQMFLSSRFEDKAGTHKDREIRAMGWLPALGFAANQRVPNLGRLKQDQRQGTIDQDPEFMAFLESETQIVTKPAAIDNLVEKDGERESVKSTPLIDDLREKKARAEAKKKEQKDGAGGTKSKHGKGDAKESTAQKESKSGRAEKVEQASKETSKAPNKQVSAKQAQANARAQSPQAQQPPTKIAQNSAKSKKQQPGAPAAVAAQASKGQPEAQSSAPTRPATSQSSAPSRTSAGAGRQRGNADGIKKMLQKDLGIKPKATTATASTPTQTPTDNNKQPNPNPTSPPPAAPSTPATAKLSTPTSPTTSTTPSTAPKATTPKAYLKHANPSQGITEVLLQNTLSNMFGPVTNVTIDPRKGTAIAVFKDNESLQKAIEAKRVPIASGAIEIMIFRDRNVAGAASGTPGPHRGGHRGGQRGGRGGSRGGGAATGGSSGRVTSAAASATASSEPAPANAGG